MGWLILSLTLSLLVNLSTSQPVETEDELDFNEKDVRDLLEKLFIGGNSRKGRQLEGELDNTIEVEDEMLEDANIDDEEAMEEETEDETMKEEGAPKELSPLEIARFNNYMDAIYRRMNAALRAKLMDPMTLNLSQNQKRKSKPENNRVTRSADEVDMVAEEEEDEDDEMDSVDRMGVAEKKKNKKKDKKGKKDKLKSKKGKKKNKGKEKKNKKPKTADEKKSKKEQRKKAREASKVANKPKEARESRGSRDHGNKHGQHKNRKNSNKKSGNKAREDKIAEREAKVVGSLAGIATLRRSGDVLIQNEENHKIVSSAFSVGPLQLEVSKSYGRGQARTIKSAKAITEVMYGNMVLKVKPDGSAHVKKVVFKSPDSVEVRGSIAEKKQRSDTYLKNSVNKMRPLAAQKILKTARFVLKAPSSVRKN